MPIVSLEELIVVGASDEEALTNQLITLVPPSWTSLAAKQRGGVFWTLMSAAGRMFAFVKASIDQMRREFRLRTATGNTLDLFSIDYFSLALTDISLPRLRGEHDDAYRARILAELLRERGTVPGIKQAVAEITGADPVILEHIDINTYSTYTGFSIDGKSAVAPFTAGSLALPYLAAFGSDSLRQYRTVAGATPALPVTDPDATLPITENLGVHLKADTLLATHTTAEPVNVWPDISGNGFDASTQDPSQAPLFLEITPGSLAPSVVFDAVDDQMFVGGPGTAFDIDRGAPFTLYVTWRFANQIQGLAHNFAFRKIIQSGGLYIGASQISGVLVNVGVNLDTAVTPIRRFDMMCTVKYDDERNRVYTWLNGRPTGSVEKKARLRNVRLSHKRNPANANVYELLIFQEAHTDEQIALMHDYLGARAAINPDWRVSPNLGLGSPGGRQFGADYQFWVFALDNPAAATDEAVLTAVKRVKPIGTVEHVFVAD